MHKHLLWPQFSSLSICRTICVRTRQFKSLSALHLAKPSLPGSRPWGTSLPSRAAQHRACPRKQGISTPRPRTHARSTGRLAKRGMRQGGRLQGHGPLPPSSQVTPAPHSATSTQRRGQSSFSSSLTRNQRGPWDLLGSRQPSGTLRLLYKYPLPWTQPCF